MRTCERTPLAWIATCGLVLLILMAGNASAALAEEQQSAEPRAEDTEGDDDAPSTRDARQKSKGAVTPDGMSRRPSHDHAEEGGGLGELLNGPSGVRVATMCTNCNVANVTMCGQTGDHVQVIADGVPVSGGLGGIYLFSVAPSELIARTEIVRGAGTVLSGAEAAVGAVVFDTRIPGREPMASASVDVGNYGWNGAKAMYMTRQGRIGGGVVATVSRSDGIDANGDGNFDLGKSERETVAVELDVELSPQTFLRVGGNSYQEEQEGSKGAYAGGQMIELGRFYAEDIDIDRVEGFARIKHDFDDGGSLSISTRYTERDQITSDNSNLYQRQPYMTIAEEFLLAAATYQRPIWDKHILLVGLEYKDMVTDGTIWDFPEQTIRDVVEQEAAFAQVDFSLPRSVNLTLGARYDSFSHPGSVRTVGIDRVENEGDFGSRVSPRARIGWKPADNFSLSLAAGAGFAAPRPILERICCGAKVQSNAAVEPERSTNLLLDADWLPWPWLHVKAGLFRNEYTDFIEKRAVFTYAAFHPAFQQVNIPEATIEGGEIALEARVERWTLALEGTRVSAKSESGFEVFPFSGATPSDPFYAFRDISYEIEAGPLIHTPRDTGSASVSFEDKRRGFSITGEAQYTGSQRIQQQPEAGIGLVVEEADTPSFVIYNVRFSMRLTDHITLRAGVDNLGNEFQTWLDDPRFEYQWGSLRGRYYYAGLSYAM